MVELPTWSQCRKALGPVEHGFPCYRLCLLLFRQPLEKHARLQEQLELVWKSLGESTGCFLWGSPWGSRCLCVALAGSQGAINDESLVMRKLRPLTGDMTFYSRQWFLACGGMVEKPQKLERSFWQCRRSAQDLFFKGWGGWSARQWDDPYIPLFIDFGLLARFSLAVSRREETAAFAALDAIYREVAKKPEGNPEMARGIYYAMWSLINAEFARWREEAYFPSQVELRAAETLESLQELLKRQTQTLLAPPAGQEVCPAVATVVRLMRENFSDKNLTVRRLAEEVYLTPSYLSGLFKKHTGKTISQYLTEIRIEYSMNLLMDKQIKISRIAEMAGYNDANYLTKTFKSHVGMTPTEYRNRYRKK